VAPFLAAARIASDLVRRPEVAHRWSEESTCAGMTVGALACHLVSQWHNAVRLLGSPAGEEPITVWEHYERAAWVHSGLDEAPNVGIREGSEESAADGPEPLLDMVAGLEPALAALGSSPRSGPVAIPWQGWSLTQGDFLLTRMMEIVVHSDDLASSVGLEAPEFPDEVVVPVLALLTGLAVRRHGQAAMVRALTRPQRAPASVAAF
jgi:hypothetical protein